MRARLGTAAHFCEVVVLKLRTVRKVFSTLVTSAISVYSGSPVLSARALFRSKVDGFVPQPRHVNLGIVGQPKEGTASIRGARPKGFDRYSSVTISTQGSLSVWDVPLSSLVSTVTGVPRT